MPQTAQQREAADLAAREANDTVRPYLKERSLLQKKVNAGSATAAEKAKLLLLEKALKDHNSQIGQAAQKLTQANRSRQGRPQIQARR